MNFGMSKILRKKLHVYPHSPKSREEKNGAEEKTQQNFPVVNLSDMQFY